MSDMTSTLSYEGNQVIIIALGPRGNNSESGNWFVWFIWSI